MPYSGGWLQLFRQSLALAIITNDSVAERELSPRQKDSITQLTGQWRAETILQLRREQKEKMKRHTGPKLHTVSSGRRRLRGSECSMCIQEYPANPSEDLSCDPECSCRYNV
ncbi:hypothetical protein EYF80_059574 [Liparis tanakae]|uniref:Uncharacterized protein n=1 Tax=Liparis tanakae TaxID=230148 RepID=A0A4Z2EPE8_9TELE|nr:hypothetical protein EYF80_059574 [Liparis tanakae]